METKEALQIVRDVGTSIAFIAKSIGKDPSTINKWVHGSSKYLSVETEEKLKEKIREIKTVWEKINI